MATYSVVFSQCGRLACAGQSNAEVIVCVTDPTILASGLNTFEATLTKVYRDVNNCGEVSWRYVVAYDSAILEDTATPLTSIEVDGIFCKGCLTTWVEDLVTIPVPLGASASNGSFSFDTLSFGNSNNFSFYTTNGSIVGSFSGGGGGGSGGAFSANGGSSTFNTLNFADSNGVTFINSNGSLVGSVNTSYLSSQSNQALSGSNGSFSFQTASFGNLNGMSFYTSNGSMVASYTVPAGGTPGFSASGGSSTFNTLNFANSNGVTFINSNGSVVGSVNTSYLTSQSNQAFSASGGSSTFQTLNFANSNGLTFSNSGGSVVASYTVPTITNSSWTVSDSGGSGSVARLAFTNLNGVTLSLSTGAGGSHTIVGSVNTNYLTTQSGQAYSAANGSNTFQTLSFADSNGVSWSTGTQGIYASVNAGTATGGAGATISAWEPYPTFPVSMSSSNLWLFTYTNVPSFRFVPFVLPQNLAVSRMNIVQSFSNLNVSTTFNLNTTGQSSSRTFGASFTWAMGIYTRETGSNSLSISAVTTVQLSGYVQQTYAASVSSTNSMTASATMNFVFPHSISSDWNYAYTTLSATATNTTAVTNTTVSFTDFNVLNGNRIVAFPFSSVMTPGEYWLALSFGSISDARALGWASNGIWYQNAALGNMNSLGIFASLPGGLGTSASNWITQGMGGATLTASTSVMPDEWSLSQIITSIGGNTAQRYYFNFSNYPL